MQADMKITIIGAGSIGGAVAFGLKKAGLTDLTVTARHRKTLEKFEAAGIKTVLCGKETALSNKEAAEGADIVIFAVKPWQMEAVMKETLAGGPAEGRITVSMAPGVTPEQLLGWAPEGEAIAYVIPNTAAEVGESMTFISAVSASPAQIKTLEELFGRIGGVLTVAPDKLRAGVALASCGIAYALRYIRAASEGGVELGFFAEDSAAVVAQTVKGAAAILKAHGSHPEQEIDKVTTPGGMTIKGLNAMEEAGFTTSVIKGLKGCLE